MQHRERRIYTAEENRQCLVDQGINPELYVKFLEQTIHLQRANYEIIKNTLDPCDRDYILALILQGELVLDICRRTIQ